MSTPDTVPTWPRIEAVAREDGTGEVVVDGNAQHVAAGSLDQVRVEIIRTVTNVAISVGRPVRVSTSGPDGYWPLIVYPNGAVIADEDQPRPGRRAAVDDPTPAEAATQAPTAPASPATPTAGHDPGAAAAAPSDSQVAAPPAVEPPAVELPAEPGVVDDRGPRQDGVPVTDDHDGLGNGEAASVAPPVERPEPEPRSETANPAAPEAGAEWAWAEPEQPTGAEPNGPEHPSPTPAGQPAPPEPPRQGEPGPAPAADPRHEPTHGTAEASPWPDQAAPGGPQAPGPYGPATHGFGQPPATFGRPPSGSPSPGQPPHPPMGQPPVGQPPMGQPPMGQPPLNQPPANQPPANQPGGRPQPARSNGQQSTGQRPAAPQRSAEAAEQPVPQQRQSFLTREQIEEPASRGFRGLMGRVGIKMSPNEGERSERADVAAVSQHWPGPRTIAVVNGKGGASKTPVTILLSAVFALFGGAGVVAWDNNQTRGTLGWRTEQGQHESTLLDLLPQIPRLLGTGAQSADLAHFVHHQTRDRFDVLRSKPMVLAHLQRLQPADVDSIHAVLGKYYRLIFIDSGNDESDPMWLRMVDHTDQLVVATTTRDDHAEAGALLLEALAERDERSAALARGSVAVVSQADPSARPADLARVAAGYQALTRATVTIPFDPAIVDGQLHYGALKPETKRAWLGAAAAVARGL